MTEPTRRPCVEALFVGLPRRFPAEPARGLLGREWTTAMVKHLVEGAVRLGPDGLEGDRPADLDRHGGPERAMLAYPAAHYRWWRGAGLEGASPGAFGENLSVAGQDEASVCIGDRLRIGSAVVRVTQPRQPGWKLARRWRRIGLPKQMAAARRTGWYLAVEQPGTIRAGAEITVVGRPCPEWTILRCLDVLYDSTAHREVARELFECPHLGEAWRSKLAVRHPALRA